MPELLKASPDMAIEYARWFVNRRAYVLQSETPKPASGRHYYYRPRRRGGELAITPRDIERHVGRRNHARHLRNQPAHAARKMDGD